MHIRQHSPSEGKAWHHMNVTEIVRQCLMGEKTSENNSLELVRAVLQHQSIEQDMVIKKALLKKLVLQYSLAERQLVELNQLKNKFLGMAAHDLRNPLASIRGFSEILLSEATGPLKDEQKEFLKIINDASSGMLKLLNDLLDVSAIESGRLDLKITEGSLKKLVEERMQLIRMTAENKNIALHASLADLPDALFDHDRLTQVVDNLLSNAIKFSPHGSNIYVSLSREGNMALTKVRDQGPGFAEEDKGKLFGEFQKLSARPTAGEKSTGLGLSIAKKIVEAHHGEIMADNAPAKGALFTFTIPLKTGG